MLKQSDKIFLVVLLMIAIASISPAAERQTLQGYVSKDVAVSKIVGDAPGSRNFNFAITISMRNKEKLEKYFQNLFDPKSQQYHQPMSDNDFIETFKPHRDYETLVNLLKSKGLKVAQEWGDHQFIVAGKLSDVENLFHIHVHEYLKPDGATFWSPDCEPFIDTDVPILRLTGFVFYNLSKSEQNEPKPPILKPNTQPTPFPIGTKSNGRQMLNCLMPDGYESAHVIGDLNESDCLELSIRLPLRNKETFFEFSDQSGDRNSPIYGHRITRQEEDDMFNPADSDYQTLIKFVTSHGFKITDNLSDRAYLGVNGTVKDVQEILHVHLHYYQRPDGSKFQAPDDIPTIDLDIPIESIWGPAADDRWKPVGGPVLKSLPMTKLTPVTLRKPLGVPAGQ